MAGELLALIVTVAAAGIVYAWKKWGKDLLAKAPEQVQDIIKGGVKELEDGELTEEEVAERLADLLNGLKDEEETEDK